MKQVMQTLPPAIRSYLAQGKYTAVAQSLMAKYGLRIDQAAVLERETMLILMGIETPEEFTQTLSTEAGLNQQTVSSIVQDVNTQIFSPLREEMRKGVEAFGKKPPQIPAAMPVRQPATASVMPRPMGVPPAPAAGAGQSASYFHLENKLPPPPRPAESAAVRPIPPRPSAQVPVAAAALRTPVPVLPQQPPRPLQSVTPITKADASVGSPTVFASGPKSINILSIAPLPPKIVLPRAVGAGLRPGTQPFPKSMDSSKLLEDHEEPHINISNKVQAASSGTPLQQALRTVLPRPAVASGVGGPPPPNLPGAMPPPDIMPPSRPAAAAPKVSQSPVAPYSADPYREPID